MSGTLHFRPVEQRAVARGVVWNVAGYVIGGVAAVALPVFLLRWLGRADYGVVMYITGLVSQAHLFNLGLGEVMAQRLTAAASVGRLWEGWAFVRAALTGVWGMTAALGGLWLLGGPALLAKLLSLSSDQRILLEEVRWLVVPAVWGIQTGMLLAWLPIALRRPRWVAFSTFLQGLLQGFLPFLVIAWTSKRTPLLAAQAILMGYALYGLTQWVCGSLLAGRPLLPGAVGRLGSLLRSSTWLSLLGGLGLLLNYVERTLIGRWISLGAMGFYTAVQYLWLKAGALLYKISEVLFPVFGAATESTWRQHFRLGQVVWLLVWGSVVGWEFLWGAWAVVEPWVPIRIGPTERRILAGAVGSWIALVPLTPVMAFLQGRGLFRAVFLLNGFLGLMQLGATPWLVKAGYLYWAPIIGGGSAMLIAAYWLGKGTGGAFWRYWVGKSYLRAMGAWLLSAGVYLTWRSPMVAMVLWGIGLGYVGLELGGKAGARKRIFLRQLGEVGWKLAQSALRRSLGPLR